MARDISLLEIRRVIFHGVPSRRTGSSEAPELSGSESTLDVPALNYLRRRLVGALTSNAYPVVFDSSANSVVPSLVLKNLAGANQDFVQDSQEIANHLFQMQPGSSPPGMLAVADCILGRLSVFAVVKLEHDEGARAYPDNSQGHPTFRLEHLRDLMLTGKARVFKVGLFIQEGADLSSIDGRVADSQAARGSVSGVADYFLRRFLGCELRQDPAAVTQDFFTATESWLNTSVPDPDKQARYTIAVLTEMRRHVDTLNPQSFAAEYLDLEDRQNFIEHFDANDVPTNIFPKNIDRVAPRLRKVSMDLESGLLILGDPDVFADKVHIETLGGVRDNGLVEITITDRVKSMRGRG